MFNEDDSGNVLLLPSNRHVTPEDVVDGMTVLWAVPQRQASFEEDNLEQEPLTLTEIDELLSRADLEDDDEEELEPNGATEPTGHHVLRELLLEAETHPAEKTGGLRVSSGIRRLRERRINRTLGVVSDWLLSLSVAFAEEGLNGGPSWSTDENLLILNLAQDVRGQIEWPEQETHQATEELVRQARERGK